MIGHCFITRNDDWVLPYHLAVYSAFCDRIVCIADRDDGSAKAICDQFPKVDYRPFTPSKSLPDTNERGMVFEDPEMRQVAWDAIAEYRPDWVVLSDTDEVPTPNVLEFIRSGLDPNVDCYYADWVNLVYGMNTAIGGTSRWSFQNPQANKKGLIVRRRDGVAYRYDRSVSQHCRLEPNPLNPGKAIIDERHVLLDQPKLIHLKYANWSRWQAHPCSRTAYYQDLVSNCEIVPIPSDWHWPFPLHECNHPMPWSAPVPVE